MELFQQDKAISVQCQKLLDVGTGGGEKLSRFAPLLQRNICNRRIQAKCGNSKEKP